MKKTKGFLAFLMALLSAIILPVSVYAASTTTYISELKMAYGSSMEDATKKLTDAGYTPIKSDLNYENKENDVVVLVGYKSTTNIDDAITDVKIMDMGGGYSFGQYEEHLKSMKNEVNEKVAGLQSAFTEYKNCIDKGEPRALFAQKMLNYLTEDDSKSGIGDFIYQNYNNTEEISKIFLQANSNSLGVIREYLALACTDNWTARIGTASTLDPILTDERAEAFFDLLPAFQNGIRKLESLRATIEASGLTAEEYLKTADENAQADYQEAVQYVTAYSLAKATACNGKTLYDVLMKDLDDLDKQELYPVVSAFTEAQAATFPHVGINIMFMSAVNDAAYYQGKLDELTQGTTTYTSTSVYAGVDRSLFTAEGIALTTAALQKQQSGEGQNPLFAGLPRATFIALTAICGACTLVAIGCAIAVDVLHSAIDTIGMAAAVQMEVLPTGVASAAPTLWSLAGLNTAKGMLFTKAIAAVKWVGIIAIGIACIVAAVLIGLIIYKEGHPTYTEVPRIMVSETELADGSREYTNYYCVTDTDGELADTNAFKQTKWNAIYTTKDANAGKPLRTYTAVQYGTNTKANYSPVTKFGSNEPFNLNAHCIDRNATEVYFFVRHGTTAKPVATLFGNGKLAIAAAIGLLLGGAAVYLVDWNRYKKKLKAVA